MGVELVDRLASIDNVIALKDATGDVVRGKKLIEKCGDRIDIYSGEDAVTLDLMRLGATGTISVTANVAPKLMSKMCNMALEGEFEAARVFDEQLSGLHKSLFLEANPIPVKWALHKMGRIGDGIRLPLTELSDKFHVEVSESLSRVKINI